MTPNASTLLAPVTSAFPKYAGVLDALATLMTDDGAIATPTQPPADPPGNPGAITVIAGRPVALAGDGTVCAFDFGDPAAPFNMLRGYNAAHVYDTPGNFVAKMTSPGKPVVTTTITVVPDTRPIVTLGVADDLAAALGKLKSPDDRSASFRRDV